MIVVLVGESASGKSTIAKLVEENMPGFTRDVTYTTRPIRDGETDNVDYHFISAEEFERKIQEDYFFEYAKYRDWWYGTALDFSPYENKIVILTPAGARALKKAFPKAVIIYLKVDRRARLIKLLERGDSIDEAYRRNLSDVGQFDRLEKEADYTVVNEKYKHSAEEIFGTVRNIIEKYRREKNEQQ